MVSDALIGNGEHITKDQLIKLLKNFFSSVALQYRYVVLVPRRCLNLWQMVRDDVEKLSPGTKWITDVGMLSFAADIANEYLRTGCFAPILYIDDVLVYGQALNRRIHRFFNLVMSALKEKSLPFSAWEDAHYQLLDAIDIHVIWRNDGKLLMSRDLSYRVSSLKTCSRDQLQHQSLIISKLLAEDSCLANTSYVVSAFSKNKGLEVEEPSTWLKYDVPYPVEVLPSTDEESKPRRLKLWLNCSVVAFGCYPVVRSHQRQDVWQYTPYILHPAIDSNHCRDMLSMLSTLVNEKAANLNLLNPEQFPAEMKDLQITLDTLSSQTSKYPVELIAHLIEMFLAQVVLACFLSDTMTQSEGIPLRRDIDKIATNFGEVLSKEALLAFCELDWELWELQDLCRCFKQSDGFYFDRSAFDNTLHLSTEEMDYRFRVVFNQMLACGCLHNLLQEGNVLRSQHYAISQREYGLFAAEDTPYYQDWRDLNLNKYLDDCSEHFDIHSQEDVQCVIAALFSLMDLGLFSLRLIISSSSTSGRFSINQSMRHTEISLSALKYLLQPVWKEIKDIANFCNERSISIKQFLLPQMDALENKLKTADDEEKPAWLLPVVIQALDNNTRLYPCVWSWS